MAIRITDGLVVLDDGVFYVELGISAGEEARAPGFLQRRCYEGVTTPGGYECVGGLERNAAGKWRASVDATYDPKTGTDAADIGTFTARMDAIVALWGARHRAHCRHLDE